MKIKFKYFEVNLEEKKEFTIRNFLLYKKLDKILFNKNLKILNFEELNNWFIKDILLGKKLLKYLNYIENRLSAELLNFWFKNEEKILNLIEKGKFKNIEFENNNDINDLNQKIECVELKGRVNLKKIYYIINELSFGEKVKLAKIFIYYYSKNMLDVEIILFSKPSDIFKMVSLRNRIAHHNFLINNCNLKWFLTLIPNLIDDASNLKNKYFQEIGKIKKDFEIVL